MPSTSGKSAAGLPLALGALVGVSRVYLEVHYPSDVLAGWAVGTVWLATCALARSDMEPEES